MATCDAQQQQQHQQLLAVATRPHKRQKIVTPFQQHAATARPAAFDFPVDEGLFRDADGKWKRTVETKEDVLAFLLRFHDYLTNPQMHDAFHNSMRYALDAQSHECGFLSALCLGQKAPYIRDEEKVANDMRRLLFWGVIGLHTTTFTLANVAGCKDWASADAELRRLEESTDAKYLRAAMKMSEFDGDLRQPWYATTARPTSSPRVNNLANVLLSSFSGCRNLGGAQDWTFLEFFVAIRDSLYLDCTCDESEDGCLSRSVDFEYGHEDDSPYPRKPFSMEHMPFALWMRHDVQSWGDGERFANISWLCDGIRTQWLRTWFMGLYMHIVAQCTVQSPMDALIKPLVNGVLREVRYNEHTVMYRDLVVLNQKTNPRRQPLCNKRCGRRLTRAQVDTLTFSATNVVFTEGYPAQNNCASCYSKCAVRKGQECSVSFRLDDKRVLVPQALALPDIPWCHFSLFAGGTLCRVEWPVGEWAVEDLLAAVLGLSTQVSSPVDLIIEYSV
jgi:hypothetical protein